MAVSTGDFASREAEQNPCESPLPTAPADDGRPARIPRSAGAIVICGGGVAAVETLLALRALLEVVAEVHLVAPNRQFVYQPLAVAAPFDLAETHLFELADLAADQNATLHEDALSGVEAERGRVRLASGNVVPYDALVVAVGAGRREWLDGALHFAGARTLADFRALLKRIEVARRSDCASSARPVSAGRFRSMSSHC